MRRRVVETEAAPVRRRVVEMEAAPVRRRGLLLLAPLLLAGCTDISVLPSRPPLEIRRFPLNPRRPGPEQSAAAGAPVLLLRSFNAAPGLEGAALRRLAPDGSVDLDFYEEWVAPPAQLAEAALRAWLQASGRYAAVVAPGSRAEPDLILEAQLTRLEAVRAQGEARANVAGLLLRQEGGGAPRVATTFDAAGRAPLTAGAGPTGEAAAMEAALGMAFARLEAAISRTPAPARAAQNARQAGRGSTRR